MKTVFTITYVVLMIALAALCVELFYKQVLPPSFEPIDLSVSADISNKTNHQAKEKITPFKYGMIIQKNLFNVDIEKKAALVEPEIKTPEKLETTTLKLTLMGTVIGRDKIYAVIEDKKFREQLLLEAGDSVQGAVIKKIMRHEVILHFQGKDQLLEMEVSTDDRSQIQNDPSPAENPPAPDLAPNAEKPITTAVILPQSDQIADLIKFRNHFVNGTIDGVMIYGIRPDSIFMQIGLKNGDILKDLNDTPIESNETAMLLFENIEQTGEGKITVIRRGIQEELPYQFKNEAE